jgi:ABC-type branched-subunit amino acid transport system ATPase component
MAPQPTAEDRARLFPYLGGRGWVPLVVPTVVFAAAATFPAVLLWSRGALAIDLNLSDGALDRFLALLAALAVLGALGSAAVTTAARARQVVQGSALLGAVAMMVLGALNEPWPLRIVLALAALLLAPTWSLARAITLDVYGTDGGWRVVAVPWAGAALGVGITALVDSAMAIPDWGFELAGAGVVLFVAAAALPPLRHPGRHGSSHDYVDRDPIALTALAVGIAIVGPAGLVQDHLADRWDLDPTARAAFVGASAIVIAGVVAIAHWFSQLARRPGAHLATNAQFLALTAGLLTAIGAASFTEIGTLVSFGMAALVAVLFVVTAEAATLPARTPSDRHGTAGLLTALVAFGGGAAMAVTASVSGISRAWLIAGCAAPVVVVSVATLASAPRTKEPAAEPVTPLMAPVSNGVPPLLVCERLAVSYDSVQVLFDVSVSVGAGQIVALLGTNGAGKTTLLRTISGLETQDRGRISFGGVDISRMDPTWRVSLGISQIAGGRAVAEGLTVAENLRMFGYSLGTDRAALRSGIEAALDAFPRLAERRNQAASTLSGGEKQMLALAKAFILRPRLLIIDEFSLGLAPKIVGELLPVVTRINQAGTAVLLVEQSVNIALSIAEHAYCMEKGEIVYDGAASRLRDDPELLRSVYLEGVSKALVR